MTLEQFIRSYEGRKVDFDKAFGAQCVDLFRQYCADVWALKKPTGGVTGAKDLFTQNDPRLKYTKNTPSLIPNAGDVIIWDAMAGNPYGHVAINVFATKNTIVVFEQDGFNQALGAYLKIRGYKYCLGTIAKA